MALAAWQATIVDESGDIQTNAQIEVRVESTGGLAALFSDRDGISGIANPFLADDDGFVRFYTGGNALRITASKGEFSRTWRHVPVGILGELDTVLGSIIKYERTDAEMTVDVTPVNYAYQRGNPDRYATNTTPGTTDMSAGLAAANAQSLESGGAPIVCSSVLHIASETIITGPFRTPRIQCFTPTSIVVFGPGSVEEVFPEWWGAKSDAAIDGSSGTDCTAAIAAAITATTADGDGAVAIHPLRFGTGNYLVGNMVIPPATDMQGKGRHITNFVCKPSTTGKWLTDSGNAAKIILADFAMYGCDETGITHGVQLGKNGVQQHGTEGKVDDIWVRDLPNAKAVEIDGNVGYYSRITTYSTEDGIIIEGVANMASHLAPYGCTGTACDLSYTDVQGLEIEAPATGAIPLYIRRNSKVTGLTISLASGTTLAYLIEIDANVTSWQINNLQLLSAGATVTNGNFKRAVDATYFGGNATNDNRAGEGNYSSENFGLRRQAFHFRITNTGGTLQHRIAASSGSLAKLSGLVNGATNSLTNTPTGADASTAMAAGAKISSANNSLVYFDVPHQADGYEDVVASVVLNDTGTSLQVLPSLLSTDINGVTRRRLSLQFIDATTGAAFALTTANIAAGKIVQVAFSGGLSP